MEYEEIASKFRNGNMIKSLKDGLVRKYSGFLTLIGMDEDAEGFDSFNKDLIVYKDGVIAEVVEQGVDKYEEHGKHIANVLKTCKRLGCTTAQLLKMDYLKELSTH